MAIQHSFKSAYTQATEAQLKGISTITEGVKTAAIAIGGTMAGAGMSQAGAGQSGALASFGQSIGGQILFQDMAGKIGGTGGHIMAAQMREKMKSLTDTKNQSKAIKGFLGEVQKEMGDNPIHRASLKTYTSVYDKLFGGSKS